jgi:hypothetical protein
VLESVRFILPAIQSAIKECLDITMEQRDLGEVVPIGGNGIRVIFDRRGHGETGKPNSLAESATPREQ